MSGKVRIGTSGWSYREWLGDFYPKGTKSGDFLEYYARRFSAVEVNATFYRPLRENWFERWRNVTPRDFLFACKAPREITHLKRLKGIEEDMDEFVSNIEPLASRLGPLLLQLPPNMPLDLDILGPCLAELPKGHRYAFEFRDVRWHIPEVTRMLADHAMACCIFEIDGKRSPLFKSADFRYIRLHGPKARYRGAYSERALSKWAERIAQWSACGDDIYCYFDNTMEGDAPRDARRLKDMLGLGKYADMAEKTGR